MARFNKNKRKRGILLWQMGLNVLNVVLIIFRPYLTLMERGQASGNYASVDYLDYAVRGKLKPITIGYAKIVATNLKCDG